MQSSGTQYLAMNRKFRIGDNVKVVGMSPVTFALGVKDELGTEKLFKSMLGKVYTVRGFDRYGNVELQLKPLNTCLGRAGIFETPCKKMQTKMRFCETRQIDKWIQVQVEFGGKQNNANPS